MCKWALYREGAYRQGATRNDMFTFVDWSWRKKEGKYRILDMETGGANRDGAALLYMAEKISKKKGKMKILIFSVTDFLMHKDMAEK